MPKAFLGFENGEFVSQFGANPSLIKFLSSFDETLMTDAMMTGTPTKNTQLLPQLPKSCRPAFQQSADSRAESDRPHARPMFILIFF